MNKFWAGMAALALAWSVTDARAGDLPTGPGCCEPPGLSADTPTAFDQNCDGRFYEGFYADGGYVLWWMQKAALPPLVTSGNSAVDGPANAAIIGQSTTQILFGGASYGDQVHNGGRLTLGYTAQGIGVQASGFVLQQRTVHYVAGNGGGPNDLTIGVPFFDADAGAENVFPVAEPVFQGGTIAVALTSHLAACDFSLTGDLIAGPGYHVTALCGFRYLTLDESLQLTTANISLGNGVPVETTFDSFSTHNHFYAGQVGLDAEVHGEHLGIEVIGKLAFGVDEEDTNINGSTSINDPNQMISTLAPQGLFAQATNSGHHRVGEFALSPELEVRLSYLIAHAVKVSVGYSFLDIDHVTRPGDAIDRALSIPSISNFGPPSTQPVFNRGSENFYAHGLDFSIAIGF